MTNKEKRQYRIRNWRQYNKALTQRGSLTPWIDPRSTDTWFDHDLPARRGRRRAYTDAAITCALLLREVYHLPLRSAQGLVSSILRLMQTELKAPHYSILSRRARSLQLSLTTDKKKIKHLVIDSGGLKVYGEGEWKVRVHGAEKRRTWRKLHTSMDASDHQITAALGSAVQIRTRLPFLLRESSAQKPDHRFLCRLLCHYSPDFEK